MGNPSCTACGATTCSDENQIKLFIGYDSSFGLELKNNDCTGTPFDLTGCTEIKAIMPGADGTPVVETKTAPGRVTIDGAPGAGKIKVVVPAADTTLLNPNPNGNQAQDLQVVVTNATGTKTAFVFVAVLNVQAAPYGVV